MLLSEFVSRNFTESWNLQGQKDSLQLFYSNFPAQSKVSKSKLLRAISSQVLNICKHDPTTSLSNLFKGLTILKVESFFFSLSGNSYILVCANCLWSCHWTPLRKIWFHLLSPSPKVFVHTDKTHSPHQTFWLWCYTVPVLSAPFYMTGAPVPSSLSPSLDLLQYIHVFLVLVSLEPDTELQSGLTSAKERSINSSLDQLAMIFLLQPRILLAFLPHRLIAGSQSPWCLPGPVCHS